VGKWLAWVAFVASLGCAESGPAPQVALGGAAGASPAAAGGFANTGAGVGGTYGGAGAGVGGGAAGRGGQDSRGWTWAACGVIPSTEVDPFRVEHTPGSAIAGGHPHAPENYLWDMTGLAMSADGQSLVSMGGVTLVWDVASEFSSSRATVVGNARPEWPKVDISRDGRWIAISGDGRAVFSRSGEDAVFLRSPSALDVAEPCFPVELRFSPDGQWIAGAGWDGTIDVFRVSDLRVATGDISDVIEPVASLPQKCGAVVEVLDGLMLAPTMRSAFSPDGLTLVTEADSVYRTGDWQPMVETELAPYPHGLRGGFEVSAGGQGLASDCIQGDPQLCGRWAAPFPKYSSDGQWIVAGGTLTHRSGQGHVLDPAALVGIFTPTDDVIVAGPDNSITRYCKQPSPAPP
jgi:WD40 repeat protein